MSEVDGSLELARLLDALGAADEMQRAQELVKVISHMHCDWVGKPTDTLTDLALLERAELMDGYPHNSYEAMEGDARCHCGTDGEGGQCWWDNSEAIYDVLEFRGAYETVAEYKKAEANV